MSNKKLRLCLVLLVFLFALPISAENQKGTLTITGVPPDVAAGKYDPDEGHFSADVREFAEALIQVNMEDVVMTGKTMEWLTKTNYLVFTVQAKLVKEDLELTGDVVEYYGDEKRLEALGNVIAITEDSTVHADQLHYDEETDEALFTGNVKVIFADGVLRGEKFLLLLDKGEVQFFGTFEGEFETDSN